MCIILRERERESNAIYQLQIGEHLQLTGLFILYYMYGIIEVKHATKSYYFEICTKRRNTHFFFSKHSSFEHLGTLKFQLQPNKKLWRMPVPIVKHLDIFYDFYWIFQSSYLYNDIDTELEGKYVQCTHTKYKWSWINHELFRTNYRTLLHLHLIN